ncbi:MAG: NAD(P)/FAD-dependent oxidoreductase [Candidatus Pelagadaptatus aseana]|uniref:flavin-containing monooxygenase n=1 Tax=Candidatus Pelagadaptatus aseana TaxID=3120508 RepID=UPI0039B2CB4F
MTAANTDIVIIGAGISGIGFGCHIAQNMPAKSFQILEGRDNPGGTWDLHRYPGIRSDSDMYTFGYRFKPWNKPKDISPAGDILDYLNETIDEFKLRDHIQFGQSVIAANWSSSHKLWRLTVKDKASGQTRDIEARYVIASTGYYDYNNPFIPQFPEMDKFTGPIIHPQLWPEDLDYSGKRVLLIGSGATAVTILPAMAGKTSHITMLQRSPSYMLPLPEQSLFNRSLRALLPEKMAHAVIWRKQVGLQRLLYRLCHHFPNMMSRYMKSQARRLTEGKVDVDKHFTPHYKPWDQRLCYIPDGDFYKCLASGEASVVTDEIAHFSEDGVVLKSGDKIEADIIISATGLNVKILQNFDISKDGEAVDTSQLLSYKGIMLSELPNMFPVIGYTAQSWTLKVDLAAQYFCKLVQQMDAQGHKSVEPDKVDTEGQTLHGMFGRRIESASYLQRSYDQVPKQIDSLPYGSHDMMQEDSQLLSNKALDEQYLIFN